MQARREIIANWKGRARLERAGRRQDHHERDAMQSYEPKFLETGNRRRKPGKG